MIRADLQGGAGSRKLDRAVAHGLSPSRHGRGSVEPVPEYSTDIATAAGLVERLVEEDPDLQCSLTRASSTWRCEFRVDDWQVSAEHSSLPTAVARATLELIRES